MAREHLWWQHGAIYQIYPRSFMDSDGDGVGDLGGILARLEHLRWLGVDAAWISPIYPSPMADFGYDVSDYTGVHPLFGTMADFDRVLAAAHAMGLKVILDLVPNHTSDRHPWFADSRSSRGSARRDWYLWADPGPDGGPPNNWRSCFGGSAWEWDEATGQYYYHAFLKEQPDLNWRNAGVRDAVLDAMRFWLDKGVDGFRVDVMWHVVKDALLRDNPRNPDWRPGMSPYEELLPVFSTDQPEAHDVVRAMRELTDRYDERVLIGEVWLPVSRLVAYYGDDGRGAHLPFNFQLMLLPWDARAIGAAIAEYEATLPGSGWPNWVLGNHDKSRIATRVGDAQARVAAVLLLTLRGTPTLYYGDEIGMRDVPVPPELVQDPQEKNVPGLGLGRDPERSPMQWDAGPNAGFTTGSPWLPLAADWRERNVAVQREDPGSMLALHRRLLALRRAEDALSVGTWRPVDQPEPDVLAYVREHAGRRFLVALNLGRSPRRAPIGEELSGRVVLSTHLDREGRTVQSHADLLPDEAIVVHVDPHLR